jgi:cytochrome c oxidase subunit 3/cytochrome c oxidase subunit I+III
MKAAIAAFPFPLPADEKLGKWGMWCFVVTEAFLFVVLFFSYFYLGKGKPWPPDPPKLGMALLMLAVLLSSSALLHASTRLAERRALGRARLLAAATAVLGAVFLVLQGLEYRERLKTLSPRSDAYGSIFYTITGVHGLHVLAGIGMVVLAIAFARPPDGRPPFRPLHDAAIYWHFVDAVWVVIVALLYVLPRLKG